LARLQSKRVFVPKTAKSTCIQILEQNLYATKVLAQLSKKGVLDEAKPAALSGRRKASSL
jgi:hypothetical protein